MHKPLTWKLGECDFVLKHARYWQSVLRFGVPVVVLYQAMSYSAFWLSTRHSGLHYPWKLELVLSVPVVFFISTLWWLLMREIAAWKLRNRDR
jgi:hypothetical protein